jgi:hypothetical protein
VKFLLDHDVPEDLSYLLQQLGHGITLVRKTLPEDAPDLTVIRRRTRAAERAALFRLLERAGSSGLENNINFA